MAGEGEEVAEGAAVEAGSGVDGRSWLKVEEGTGAAIAGRRVVAEVKRRRMKATFEIGSMSTKRKVQASVKKGRRCD